MLSWASYRCDKQKYSPLVLLIPCMYRSLVLSSNYDVCNYELPQIRTVCIKKYASLFIFALNQ